MVTGSASSFTAGALATIGRSLKRRSFVFDVWPSITKERLVEDLTYVEYMAACESITAFFMVPS